MIIEIPNEPSGSVVVTVQKDHVDMLTSREHAWAVTGLSIEGYDGEHKHIESEPAIVLVRGCGKMLSVYPLALAELTRPWPTYVWVPPRQNLELWGLEMKGRRLRIRVHWERAKLEDHRAPGRHG